MASPSVVRFLSLAQQEGPISSQGHFRGFSFRRGKRKSPSRGESAGGGKRPPVLRGRQPAWGLHGPSGVKVGVEVLLPPSKRTVCRGPFSLLENSFADGCLGHKAGEVSLTQRGSLSFDPSETLPSGSPDASVLLWTPSNDFTHFTQMCDLLKGTLLPAMPSLQFFHKSWPSGYRLSGLSEWHPTFTLPLSPPHPLPLQPGPHCSPDPEPCLCLGPQALRTGPPQP